MNSFITIKPDEDNKEYPLIDLRNTEKRKGKGILLATKYFVSSFFYEIVSVSTSEPVAYLEAETPTGMMDLFKGVKEKFFFKKLEYIGYSPNGFHVFKGLPFEDHRNLKGVPRSKKYLRVHIKPDDKRFTFRYAKQQHPAIQ